MEHVAHFFIGIVEKAGYPGLFAVMMLGNLGVPVATEFVMLSAGALAATGHFTSVFSVGPSRRSANSSATRSSTP